MCTETLSFCPDHPILKIGVTVQIGLDKTVKLEKVFNRYVDFCNEQHPAEKVELSDLEFVHSQVLSGHDTAEAAALMKNDRLSVRPEQSFQRKEEEQRYRMQRESDKEYFQQLRQLLPMQTSSGRTSVHPVDYYADVLLDCRGSLPAVNGQLQQQTTPESSSWGKNKLIRAHSFLLHKRCSRLGTLITRAKEEHGRRSVVTVPPADEVKQPESDNDDDFEMLQQFNDEKPIEANGDSPAAQIENDDDDEDDDEQLENPGGNVVGSGAQAFSHDDEDLVSPSGGDENRLLPLPTNLPVVVIEDHPPQAVKLLLEYCYTNRVVPLGYEAFMQAGKSKQEHIFQYRKHLQGPVAPHSYRPTRWPNCGEPVVSFAVALAGIRLAEEFEMPRFSLMCEVAAAQLVEQNYAMDALQECESQRCLTGNELPRLRKAAMDIVLQCCAAGGGAAALVNSGLEDRGRLVVPTLFMGTMEAVKEAEEKKKSKTSTSSSSSSHNSRHHHLSSEKRDWQRMAFSYFDKYDRNDTLERDRERRKRARGEDPAVDDYDDETEEEESSFAWSGEAKARSMSLKRMSRHHLSGRSGGGFDLLGLTANAGLSRRGGKSRHGG